MKTKKNINSHISLKPLIFDDKYLSKYIHTLKPDYDYLCRELYEKSHKYLKETERKISKINTEKILYMNFKSHNIFNDTSRQKLFLMFEKTNPNIICLSEVLVPVFIANNMGKLIDLRNIKKDIIIQPFKAQTPFTQKKMMIIVILEVKKKWRILGYQNLLI